MAGPAPIEIERNGTTIRLHGEIDVETIASVLDALERAAC
jgi:ABC-type transporter Mla MlaB component